jgi:hypothetical protein
MSALVTNPTTRSCGCGGTGSVHVGSGCGGGCSGTGGCSGGCGGACGCGGTTARTPSGGFARPRFFAGQVLLDDDLAAIESYVVGKNRLRNRFLHGDGVVCGLDVTCHPCGGGSVLVGSGYALDCCGNDIMVPCREELDIPDMIRQLRAATNGGYDCGPCLPEADATKDVRQVSGSSSEEGDGSSGPVARGSESRCYWLYVRYAEQLSDPVEPYATDAVCSPAGCEASRVREGYQFFLRSHRCRTEYDDIITRALACVDSPEDLLRILGITRLVKSILIFLQSLTSSAQSAQPQPPSFKHPQVGRVVSFAAGAPDAPVPKDPTSTGQLIDDLAFAAATVLRAKALDEEGRKAAGLTDAEISDTSAALKTAAQKLTDLKVLGQVENTARPFAEAILRTAVRVADQQTGQPLATDNRLLRTTVTMLREQKAWLLKMAERVGATDCRLAEDVAAVHIPVIAQTGQEPGEGGLEESGENQEVSRAQEQLDKLTRRFVISCLCAALNPPCPSCTDDAVLLAGIEVFDCEVQSICQVVRRNVVSGPGLRYWLALNRIPTLLEKVCCAADACAPSPSPSPDEGNGSEVQPLGTPLLGMALRAAISEQVRVPIEVAQVIAGPDTRTAALLEKTLNPPQLRTDLAERATGSPEVREVLGSLAVEAVKDAAAEGTVLTGQNKRLAELESTLQQRLKQLDEQLAEVTKLRDSLVQHLAPSAPPEPAKKAPAKRTTRTPRGGGQR